ncbi:hypothetical protein TA5114_01317 [Cognatishimia activa]|uniref:Uncharacterized protein n=1 Tax=Cognatishimia activa TaxID=1715691 RepID=A0A0P1IPQ4_9RHOB|nr:hypothetical protein TA5113_02615 [Cognatishimia activa]CUK25518.1 hypothetical protein TA5114_01317 [Cognatishimia activa]
MTGYSQKTLVRNDLQKDSFLALVALISAEKGAIKINTGKCNEHCHVVWAAQFVDGDDV